MHPCFILRDAWSVAVAEPISLSSTFTVDVCLNFPMSSLDYNFTLLKYCGIWRPRDWSPGWKTRFYSSYTAFVIIVVFAMSLAEMIDIFLSLNNIEEFADGMFMLLTMISCCGKILTLLVYRQRIILLLETLECRICQTNNSMETAVRETYHQSMRIRTKAFTCVVISTIVVMTISYCSLNIPRRTLPLRIWLPFDVGTDKVYWLVFFEEFLSLFFAAIIDIAYDTLVPAFMSSICEQFGLLECRIRTFVMGIDNNYKYSEKHRIKLEKKQFADFVQHHLLLFRFADEANDIFGPAILVQYISRTELTDASQTFSSAMYSARWDKLHASNKKSLILMMTRSSTPIIFSTAKLIQMSLDSYLKYCGIWRPRKWSPGWKTRFYSSYTAFVIIVVFAMTLAEMTDIILTLGNVEDFVGGMFMLLTMMSCCGKILTMLLYRQRIILLLETLESHICRTNNHKETVIREVYQQSMRIRTKAYTAVVAATIVVMTISYCTINIPRRTLPLRIWLPFDVGTHTIYWLVYFEEFLSLFIAAVIDIAYDTLVPGFMGSICEQFGLLAVRIQTFAASIDELKHFGLNRINLEKKQFTKFIQHHLLLFQLNETNRIFGPAILLQYIASSMVLCMCVYQLGQIKSFDIQLLSIVVYTSAMFLEIFLVCLAGTELTAESQAFGWGIYNLNWYTLNSSSKMTMILMMIRSSKPIVFTSGKLIEMSLDSYLKLIKFSYSTYNFLQRSSSK
ncbi:hypothetical protein PV327_005570 [Microctonus hyperodae]|uniref:Odorant receptor n=1 Tax=Microctonus hyperodae TaxID=165561 RepID=A0AA39KZT9_MICHY|nr:hypothetical protein PV327_005570 [Microctonus hyperodae]